MATHAQPFVSACIFAAALQRSLKPFIRAKKFDGIKLSVWLGLWDNNASQQQPRQQQQQQL
jgi:hypothetical protein